MSRSAAQIAAQKKAAAASAAKRKRGGRTAVRVKLDSGAKAEGYTRKTLNDFMRTESRTKTNRGITAGGPYVRKRAKGSLQKALRSKGKIGK